jgi:type IV pilus assembly protein PilW
MATIKQKNGQSGFSLLELMVALAVSGIVLAGIYGAYQDQLRTSITQERIVDMNQNLRVAMYIIERDLRMGGANPTGETTVQAGFTVAQANVLQIAMDDGGTDNMVGLTPGESNAIDDGIDNDEDGMIDERDDDGVDNDGDGETDEADEETEWFDGDTTDQSEIIQFDLNGTNLRRLFNTAGSNDPTAAPGNTRHGLHRNIDALNFVYLDGAEPSNVIPTPVTGTDLEDIRSVQVTIVARAGATVPVLARKVTDNTVYRNPQGTVVFGRPRVISSGGRWSRPPLNAEICDSNKKGASHDAISKNEFRRLTGFYPDRSADRHDHLCRRDPGRGRHAVDIGERQHLRRQRDGQYLYR